MTKINKLQIPGSSTNNWFNYFKSIGLMRILSLQCDPSAKAYFENSNFFIETTISKEELLDFFIEKYVPLPVLTPFARQRNNHYFTLLSTSDNYRLSIFRQAYETLKLAPPKKRSYFPSIEWLNDIEQELKHLHPSSVGSYKTFTMLIYGVANALKESASSPFLVSFQGTFDKLQIEENYIAALSLLIDFTTENGGAKKESRKFLEKALFLHETTAANNIFEFCTSFVGDNQQISKTSNPWDYILAINGIVAMYSSFSINDLTIPLCFQAVCFGWEKTDHYGFKKTSKRELWLPLWNKPLNYSEFINLINSFARSIKDTDIKTGLDFVALAAVWGINPLLTNFLRLGLIFDIEASPLPFAKPLGELMLRQFDDFEQIDTIRTWVFQWQENLSLSPKDIKHQQKLKAVEESLFAYLVGETTSLTKTLVAVGCAEKSATILAKNKRVDPIILPQRLINSVQEDTPEFRLALALASLDSYFPPRMQFLPVSLTGGRWLWNDSVGVQGANLLDRLTHVLEQRLQFAEDKRLAIAPIRASYPARFSDIDKFLAGEVDEAYLEALINGLILIDFPYPKKEDKPSTLDSENNLIWYYKLLREAFLSPAENILHYKNLRQLILRLRFSSLNESIALARNIVDSQDYPLTPILQPSLNLNKRLLAAIAFHGI